MTDKTTDEITELTSDIVRIEDPAFYFDDAPAVYPRLQADHPVFYYEPLDIFVLTRHEDIKEAARRPEIFSSARGLHLHELRLEPEERERYRTLFDPAGEQFAYADPPRHRELRAVASRSFAPRAIAHLTERMEEQVATLLGRIEPGRAVDFVDAVAAPLPIKVAEELIGLPAGHDDEIRAWSDALESLKLVRGPAEIGEAVAQFGTMNDFFREQIAYKRKYPGTDLISTLLAAELDGAPLSEPNLLIYCSTFLAAGSDTTRSLLSGMAHALAVHPDQLARLHDDPALLDRAVEESLRWTTPARGFARTAVTDTKIHDTTIKAGQRVYLLFDAGNRDASVFDAPWTYDIGRSTSALHLAFGFGVHLCIAAHLARLEARVLFRALLDRFEHIELAGEPRPIRQVLRNGWYEMPLAFS
jgi:cytochrome P450